MEARTLRARHPTVLHPTTLLGFWRHSRGNCGNRVTQPPVTPITSLFNRRKYSSRRVTGITTVTAFSCTQVDGKSTVRNNSAMAPAIWLDLKRRWLRLWLVWIFWIPVAALFGAGERHPLLSDDFISVLTWRVAHWLHLPDMGDWAYAVLAVWAIAMFVALKSVFCFVCPHCQKPFFARKPGAIPSNRTTCAHCNSPKWS
jgi:hypothetical protein